MKYKVKYQKRSRDGYSLKNVTSIISGPTGLSKEKFVELFNEMREGSSIMPITVNDIKKVRFNKVEIFSIVLLTISILVTIFSFLMKIK